MIKGETAVIKITYSDQKKYKTLKNLAKEFNKAQELSYQMCRLREALVQNAVLWANRMKDVKCSGEKMLMGPKTVMLLASIEDYVKFKNKHFKDKK